MRIIEEHGLDEVILQQVLGWRWMSFVGLPTRDTAGYPKVMRVRQLFSPTQLEDADWLERYDARDADGTEPRAYCYCSSVGPAVPPRLFILVD